MPSFATLRPARAPQFGLAACVVGGLLLGACESNKNYDERQRFAEANGFIDDEPCVGTCIEYDPPEPLDPRQCAEAEAGLEFVRIWEFNAARECMENYAMATRTTEAGVEDYCKNLSAPQGPPEMRFIYPASLLFQYSDGTGEFRRPLKPDPDQGYQPGEPGWEPDTEELERCAGEGGRVLHVWGGPYEAWGGGMGRTLIDKWPSPKPQPGASIESKTDWRCAAPEDHQDPEDRCTGLDLTEWEGISFWAARGPDSQGAIRPMLGDWKADDDWSYLLDVFGEPEPRECYRAKECDCTDGKPCSLFAPNGFDPDEVATAFADDGIGGYYCYDPDVDPDPTTIATYDTCGVTECRKYAATFEPNPDDAVPNASIDPRFAESECVEYDYRTGLTDTLCYTPGVNRPPPESDQKCGDHWMSPVRLSREWKFYKVPFGDLLQQGWAKEFAHIDLSNVTTFRFTYGRGWIDYYIDDVSFYRKQRDAADEAE